jgi:hypothetical protein
MTSNDRGRKGAFSAPNWTPIPRQTGHIVQRKLDTHSTGALLVERLLHRRQHQAFRSCFGVLSLGQKYGSGRLETASAHVLKHTAVSWKSVQAILKNGLDMQQQDPQRTLDLPEHENMRGAAHYQSS